MKTFRFLQFQVYIEAKNLYRDMVSLTQPFPRQHWELGDQIRRSSLSVCLNIAEGSAKRSDKDFNRFIEISLGSINEVVAGLDLACECALITKERLERSLNDATSITRQLGGFSRILLKKQS